MRISTELVLIAILFASPEVFTLRPHLGREVFTLRPYPGTVVPPVRPLPGPVLPRVHLLPGREVFTLRPHPGPEDFPVHPLPAKPGTCPRFTFIRKPLAALCEKGDKACIKRYCKDDHDCPADQKCCSRGFFPGRFCTTPVYIPKHGTCPCYQLYKKSLCNVGDKACLIKMYPACKYDHDCPADKKCCSFGLFRGRFCTTPVYIPKPGTCPRFPFIRKPLAALCEKGDKACIKRYCKDDHDCPADKKCCSGGLFPVRFCTTPV